MRHLHSSTSGEDELERARAQATRALSSFRSASVQWERTEWWEGYTEAVHRILDLVLDRKLKRDLRQDALQELVRRAGWDD